ncbi:hypothetical protein SETIT_6G214300v2 [Setaria italica]|uniref:Uncharacterized protein n=1 Tax=Setaria italica TaxID=4555 RepID=A0A368RP08_SETIT|nr:hypothetical protein SETIT_6G214300v2 [Setaria italica]
MRPPGAGPPRFRPSSSERGLWSSEHSLISEHPPCLFFIYNLPPLRFPLRRRPSPPPSPATVTTGPLVEDSGMGDVRPPPGDVWPGLPSIASFPTCFKEKKVPFSYFLTQRAATVRRARSITRRAVRGFPFLSPRMAPPRRPAGRLSPGRGRTNGRHARQQARN